MNSTWLSSRDIDSRWDELAPYLERFERETEIVRADVIRQACISGDKQLWAVHDERLVGVVVTQVLESPKGRICEVYAACGACPRYGMREVSERIKQWAAGVGCTYVRIYGRKGWKRVLPEFKQTGVILEQRL